MAFRKTSIISIIHLYYRKHNRIFHVKIYAKDVKVQVDKNSE